MNVLLKYFFIFGLVFFCFLKFESAKAICAWSPCPTRGDGGGYNFGSVYFSIDSSSQRITMYNAIGGGYFCYEDCNIIGVRLYPFIRVINRAPNPNWNTRKWTSGDCCSAAGHCGGPWNSINLYTQSAIAPGSPALVWNGGGSYSVYHYDIYAQFTDLNDGDMLSVTPAYLAGNTGCNFGCDQDPSYTRTITYVKPNYYRPIFYQAWPPNGITMCYNGFGLQGFIRDYDYPSTGNYASIYSTAYGWTSVNNSGNLGDWGTAAIGGRNWPSGGTSWYGYAYDRYGDGPTPGYYNFNINRAPSVSFYEDHCNQTISQPTSVCFGINANDPDGNFSSTNIYINGGAYGGTRVCPYLNPGNYSRYAQVCDQCGQCAQTSTCNFRVNDIPTMTITNLSPRSTTMPGCGIYDWTVYANDTDNISWDLNDNGDARMTPIRTSSAKGYTSGSRTIGYGNKWVSLSGVIRDQYISVGATNNPGIRLNCEPNQPTQPTGSIGVCNASGNPVTVASTVGDPDGNVNVIFTISGIGVNISQPLGLRSGYVSTNFNIPFDSTVTQIIVSVSDPVGGINGTKISSSNVWLPANKTPINKVSDTITYNSNNYGSTSNPRLVIDYAATRLQPVRVDDHSFDPDGNNQNVQATFWLEVNNATSGAWQNIATSGLINPNNINAGTYYHNITYNNLYAGLHRYRAQDRDACGATSLVSSYYNFTVAPPAPRNITVNSGTNGCPTCGNRNTAIVIDWDDMPYIQNAQASGIGGGYYVEWSNDGGTTYRAVTKSLPDANAGWTSDSRIVLVTDVLNLYNLGTSTVRNIRYRVAAYSNGVYSDWLYSNIVTYNCPIPGGLTISPNPIDMKGDEDSQAITARIHCRDFNGNVVGVLGGDMISAAQANRIYPPDINPVSFVWNQADIDSLNTCSTGTRINTPPNPGNIIHAGSNTTVDPCEGKLGATLTNYGWPEIGALTGDTWVSINPRATEEFNYSGEVISNPPPGFEKLDLPGVQ